MNASIVEVETAQVNTIHRCRQLFETIHFKYVQHTTVSLIYNHEVYSLQDEQKFIHFLKTEACATELHALRRDML